MAYPPPPGSTSTPLLHPSLPARPPPSSLPSAAASPRTPSFSAFGGFAPRQVVAPTPVYHAPMQPPGSQPQQHSNAYPQQQHPDYGYGAAPQIRNPFAPPPPPGSGQTYQEEDPEMAAQIAQWQSAYSGTTNSSSGYTGVVAKRYSNAGEGAGSATSANAAPLGGSKDQMNTHAMSNTSLNDNGVAAIVSDAITKHKTVVRTGGGTKWTDDSLLEWDPAHYRLFVGNLAGEVTDETLLKAFSKWPSTQKARVVRDKRTTKSKGYGFVSFSDGEEFFQAGRNMQGKYIGSHPVIVRKSNTEIKAVTPKDHRKNKNRGKGGNNKDKDRTGGGRTQARQQDERRTQGPGLISLLSLR